MEILILGCGFTGIRVAQRFLSKGAQVTVTTRDPARLANLPARVITLNELPGHLRKGMLVLHSIPPEGSSEIPILLRDAPSRVVYLSTTAVYGSAHVVDETTPVDDHDERARPRLIDEARIANGPWSSLILRPAGIYGPGRGAHESVRRGTYVAGDNYVSRIHVDDLATQAEAALLSTISGAYPVADEYPATTREVEEFCSALLGIPSNNQQSQCAVGRTPSSAEDPLVRPGSAEPSPGVCPFQNSTLWPDCSIGGYGVYPVSAGPQSGVRSAEPSQSSRRAPSNRKVDGAAIRRLLGITLAYPSYRTGIPAALAEQQL